MSDRRKLLSLTDALVLAVAQLEMAKSHRATRAAAAARAEAEKEDGEEEQPEEEAGAEVHMVVDATKSGTDGLYYSSEPTPYYGAPSATAWPSTAKRGAPRIKVHNGTVVVGSLSSEHPGWLELSGWQRGYWLPTAAGGMPVLHRVPPTEVQIGAWKRSNALKEKSHQKMLDAYRKREEEAEARTRRRQKAQASRAKSREAR